METVTRRRWLTDRQRQGLLTALLLLATSSDAVTFWAAYQKRSDRIAPRSKTNNDCDCASFGSADAASCTEDTPTATATAAPEPSRVLAMYRPSRLFPRARIAHPIHRIVGGSDADSTAAFCRCCEPRCCNTLQQLMLMARPLSQQSLKHIPRGGAHILEAATLSAAASHTSHTSHTPFHWPLNAWKVIFQCCLTAINVLFWLVPLQSRKITENKLTLSLANAFSGGVFLSLAFGHLIPECVSGFQNFFAQLDTSSAKTQSLGQSILRNEAVPYMLVLSGYLLIFFVEKVAFDADGALHQLEHAKDHTTDTTPIPTTTTTTTPPPPTTTHPTPTTTQDHSTYPQNLGPSMVSSSSSISSDTLPKAAPIGRSALILLAALAVHSILEMTALGLADSFGDCSLLSLSIALHQVCRI